MPSTPPPDGEQALSNSDSAISRRRPAPKRRPDRGVAPPARVAREQQVREVHTDDQQDGSRRGEQHEQRSSRVADDHRLQRLHDGPLAPVVFRLCRDRRLERVQLGAQRLRRRARAHAPDHAVIEIAGRSELVCSEFGRTQHVVRLRPTYEIPELLRARDRCLRWQHADNRHGCAVERDRPADDGGIAPEFADPQRVADDGDEIAARTIVRVREGASWRRADAEQGKELPRHARRVELLGFTGAGQRGRSRIDRCHRLAGGASFAPRLHMGCVHRERRVDCETQDR